MTIQFRKICDPAIMQVFILQEAKEITENWKSCGLARLGASVKLAEKQCRLPGKCISLGLRNGFTSKLTER